MEDRLNFDLGFYVLSDAMVIRLDIFMLRVVEVGGPFRCFYVKSGGGWWSV